MASGGGSSALAAHYATTPLDSFKKAVSTDQSIKVDHTPGVLAHRYVPLLDIDITRVAETETPGYSMEYWTNMNHSGEPVHVETKHNSLLLCYDNLPPQLTTGERYSYRARTHITPRTSGRHAISLSTCGSGKLILNGEVIISIDRHPWSPKSSLFMSYGSPEETVHIDMVAGQRYELILESVSREPWVQEMSLFGDIRREEVMDGGRIGYLEEVDESAMLQDAVKLSAESDLVVLVVGKNHEWEGETSDQVSMDLPRSTNMLVQEVLRANPNTIVVNQTGSATSMPWIEDASAVVQVNPQFTSRL